VAVSTVEIRLDDDLLALVDERAAASGKAREEVIAEAVRKQFQGGRLHDILEAARERSDLSQDEAMRLAIEEQRPYRAEHARDVG
jgi:predicted transcriptional regulator